jgi:hypothetical protein
MTSRTMSEETPESVREGLALLEYHFFPGQDPAEKYLRADSFRENVIRLIVFDMHLAIEELLRAQIHDTLARSSASKGDTDGYVRALSSRQALDLAAQLGVVDAAEYKHLRELNSLRNRAAHHWQLDEPLRHRSGPAPEPYLLRWNDARLTPKVVEGEFLEVYGAIYVRLLGEWRRAHGAPQDGPGG